MDDIGVPFVSFDSITHPNRSADSPTRSGRDDDSPSGGRTGDLGHDMAAAWSLATNGDLATAYATLRSLVNRYHGHVGLLARLYWLLWIEPSLDADRQPIEWLLEGLRESGPRGPLWELYRQSLLVPPVAALDHAPPMLTGIAVDPGPLVDLARVRIEAAGRRGYWSRISEDLDLFRDPILDAARDQWTQLLGLVLERAAWWTGDPRARELTENLVAELQGLAHLHHEASEVFDRQELLHETVAGVALCSRDRELAEIGTLVRDAWTEIYGGIERRLMSCLAGWADDPEAALALLDRGAQPAGRVGGHGHLVLVQFLHLVECHLRYDRLRQPDRALAEEVRDACHTWTRFDYASIRPEILDFCLAEWLTVDQLVACCLEDRGASAVDLQAFVTWLHPDLPLRIVTSGLRALSDAAS